MIHVQSNGNFLRRNFLQFSCFGWLCEPKSARTSRRCVVEDFSQASPVYEESNPYCSATLTGVSPRVSKPARSTHQLYVCEDVAVYPVVPDGGMWQLRYDDTSLSAGFMIEQRPSRTQSDAIPEFSTAADEWNWRIDRAPFLADQFRDANIIRLDSGLQLTGRIQRLAAAGAGPNWAALTNTVGFIDPLHSTGIAHTLFAVSRLADILTSPDSKATRESRLTDYSRTLIEEIRCVDELVEGCYQAIPSFQLWCLWGMLYFAAATSMEQQTEA